MRPDAARDAVAEGRSPSTNDASRSDSLFPLSARATFLLGLTIGVLLTFVQASAVGGPSGMLMVGERSDLADIIEGELGPVVRSPGSGHDGQMVFAIATDLTGEEVPPLLDHAGYRYRRILLPAVASGFGLIGGPALLWSLLAWNVLSFAVAASAMSILARKLGRSSWAVAGVLANPGLWLSINIVTSDVMASGLALLGLAAMTKRRHGLAILAMALAALAKDQYLIVAVGAAIFYAIRRRPKLSVAYSSAAVPLLAWTAFLELGIESAFSPRSNFGLPFVGLWESIQSWDLVGTSDVAYGAVLVVATAVGAVGLTLRRNWRLWPFALPWIAMAVLASSWVWLLGNNALRSLSPIIVWAVFAFSADSPELRDSRRASPPAEEPRASG